MGEFGEWLEGLESDLRERIDRTDALDDLFQVTFCGDGPEIEQASRCLAKMAQNGCGDMRVLSILMSMRDVSDAVSENVCWGLGELAGAGIGDSDGLDYVLRMTASACGSLCAMALWSAGRYASDICSDDPRIALVASEFLLNDSPLIRMAAESCMQQVK